MANGRLRSLASDLAPSIVLAGLCLAIGTWRYFHKPGLGTADSKGYLSVPFNFLSRFDCELPSPQHDLKQVEADLGKVRAAIPSEVKALDGKKVALSGFLIPYDAGSAEVHNFILTLNPITCCFGAANRINEYAMVLIPSAKDGHVPPGSIATVKGILRVGPIVEDGVVAAIYRVEGESLEKGNGS